MKRLLLAATVVAVMAAAPSYAEMRHMKDHMDGMKGMKNEAAELQKEAKAAETMESEAAGVTVKITFINPEAPKSPSFTVSLDTHSVDLEQYKFDEIILLRDDSGKEHHADPVSSSGSGHHREATVEFKDMDISSAKYVELVIEDVAGVAERVFRFDVKK